MILAPSTDLPSAESTQFHGCMKDVTVKDIDSPEHTAVHTTTPHHQHHITAQCLDALVPSIYIKTSWLVPSTDSMVPSIHDKTSYHRLKLLG